jgi:hypothetical protein
MQNHCANHNPETFLYLPGIVECEKIKSNDASGLSVAALFAEAMIGSGPVMPLR